MQLLNKILLFIIIFMCVMLCMCVRARIEGLCDASRKIDSVDDYNHQFFYQRLFSPFDVFSFFSFHFLFSFSISFRSNEQERSEWLHKIHTNLTNWHMKNIFIIIRIECAFLRFHRRQSESAAA